MAEKSRDSWHVALYWLRDRRRVASLGVQCNGCGHKHFWPIGELMQEYGPYTLVSNLWQRWRCAECGSLKVVPSSVSRLKDKR